MDRVCKHNHPKKCKILPKAGAANTFTSQAEMTAHRSSGRKQTTLASGTGTKAALLLEARNACSAQADRSLLCIELV